MKKRHKINTNTFGGIYFVHTRMIHTEEKLKQNRGVVLLGKVDTGVVRQTLLLPHHRKQPPVQRLEYPPDQADSGGVKRGEQTRGERGWEG